MADRDIFPTKVNDFPDLQRWLRARWPSMLTDYLKLAGRSGGQTAYGDTADSGSMTLSSTASSIKGLVYLGSAHTSAFDEVNNRLGIGTPAPAQPIHVLSSANSNTAIRVENNSAVGTSSAAVLQALGDVALGDLIAHGSARVVTRCGVTLGGWCEVLSLTGNGLLIDTNNATPIVLGTNNAERMRIDSSGNVGIGGSSFGGGVGVIQLANAGTNPTSNPASGGILYSDTGTLKWRNSAGTTTSLGPYTATAHRVKCRISANQSIATSTDTDVLFDTEDYDTDGYHPAGASASFTVPVGLGGLYGFACHARFASSTGSSAREIFVSVNGTEKHRARMFSTASNETFQGLSGYLLLSVGDVVKMRVRQQDAGALNLLADADRTSFTLTLLTA